MYRSLFFLPLVLWVLITGKSAAVPGKAEEKAVEQDDAVPQTQIAVIALGPTPPRRYSESRRGGESVMLLPAPGEVPPARLFIRGDAPAGEQEDWEPFNLSFNNPSPMRSVPAGETLSLYRRKTDAGEYERYVTIPAGEEGVRRVIFLTPSASGGRVWIDPPRVWRIELDQGDLQGKQFMLQNLSRTRVLHAFDKTITEVRPEKIISYQRAGAGMIYRLAARYGSQKKIIYNMAVRLDAEGNRHLYALYDANPQTNAGRSVGVFKTVIPVRQADPAE